MLLVIDLEQALSSGDLVELRELLRVWKDAQEQLAILTHGYGPDSVDYQNLIHDNPELELRISAAVNTLQEVWAEVAAFTIPLTTKLIKHLSAADTELPWEWEQRITAQMSDDPAYRLELMKSIASLRRSM